MSRVWGEVLSGEEVNALLASKNSQDPIKAEAGLKVARKIIHYSDLSSIREALDQVLSPLTEMERKVVRVELGVTQAGVPNSLDDVCSAVQKSKSSIRRIERSTLSKL